MAGGTLNHILKLVGRCERAKPLPMSMSRVSCIEWMVKSLGQTKTDEFHSDRRETAPSLHSTINGHSYRESMRCHMDQQSLHEDLELWTRNPSRAYKDEAGTERIVDDMWTASHQKELPEGVTIAPIILASDKTMLSQFRGDKSAWPVYLRRSSIVSRLMRDPSLDTDCSTTVCRCCWSH